MVLAQPFGILRRQHRDMCHCCQIAENELLAMASDSSAGLFGSRWRVLMLANVLVDSATKTPTRPAAVLACGV